MHDSGRALGYFVAELNIETIERSAREYYFDVKPREVSVGQSRRRLIFLHAYVHAYCRSHIHTCMRAYSHADKQTNRQTNRQTASQPDRQTDGQACMHACIRTVHSGRRADRRTGRRMHMHAYTRRYICHKYFAFLERRENDETKTQVDRELRYSSFGIRDP